MAMASWKLTPKDPEGMVAALTKEATKYGFKFKGDKKSGKGTKDNATIGFVLKDKDVTLEWDVTGMTIDTLERIIKDWIRPFK
jgi:hypothetical protein